MPIDQYMANPVQHSCATTHGDICFFEWGSAGVGSSILLLHATGFHARCWDKVVDAFPPTTHVIAVDQLGHGRSAKPDKLTNWSQLAGATIELLDQLNIRFDIAVGHSMGGHCLVQAAEQRPQYLNRLVLVDPVIMDREIYQNPPDYNVSEMMTRKRRNHWTSPGEMFDRFKDRHPYRLWDSDVLKDYCEYGLLDDGEGGYNLACPPEVEGAVYGTSGTLDPWVFVDQIEQSVTVLRAPKLDLQDGFDFASSPTPDHLAEAFSNGTDVYVPDLTHFMPMQDPEHIASLILGRS